MKQVDKKTQDRLLWFLVPMGAICVLMTLDITFGVNLNIEAWVSKAMFGCVALFILAYAIAAWRQKCWGLLSMLIFVFVVGALSMSNVFDKLLFPDAP